MLTQHPGAAVCLSGTKAMLPPARRIIKAQAVQGTGAEAKSTGEGDLLLLLLLSGSPPVNIVSISLFLAGGSGRRLRRETKAEGGRSK